MHLLDHMSLHLIVVEPGTSVIFIQLFWDKNHSLRMLLKLFEPHFGMGRPLVVLGYHESWLLDRIPFRRGRRLFSIFIDPLFLSIELELFSLNL